MSEFLQVVTTTDSRESAASIADALVERRLAACVQVAGPITSTYWWNGRRESSEEWICVIKTEASVYGALEKAILDIHPYDVPEILATPVAAGSSTYLAWLGEQLGG